MVIADRLRHAIEASPYNQSELARRVRVSQGTISGLLSGASQTSSHLHKIARELGTTTEYLSGETDDPNMGALPVPTPETVAEQLDLVPVPEISLQFGMGSTFLSDHDVDQMVRWFPRDWLEMFTPSPAHLLVFARGRGDSMMPTILDGDIVLIDRGDTHMVEQDRVFAVGYGDLGGLKRLRSVGQGNIKIMSDNPSVRDEILTMDEIRIIGRVVGNLRRM